MATQAVNVTQGYLEMARYWGSMITPETEMTHTTTYTILAEAYVFSYMAINAYTSFQLSELWNNQQASFRNKYPHRNTVAELLGRGGELSDLQTALKVFATESNVTSLHVANGQLWSEFNQVVREARDFFIHPKPGPGFQQHIDTITHIPQRRMAKDWWRFPVRVAEDIITYFQVERGMTVPDWVTTNQELVPHWGIVSKDHED